MAVIVCAGCRNRVYGARHQDAVKRAKRKGWGIATTRETLALCPECLLIATTPLDDTRPLVEEVQ